MAANAANEIDNLISGSGSTGGLGVAGGSGGIPSNFDAENAQNDDGVRRGSFSLACRRRRSRASLASSRCHCGLCTLRRSEGLQGGATRRCCGPLRGGNGSATSRTMPEVALTLLLHSYAD